MLFKSLLIPMSLLLSLLVASTTAVDCKPFICHVKDCCKTADGNLGCKFTDDLSFTGWGGCQEVLN